MSSNTSSTKVDIPRWDGTRESYSTYSFKINALCSVLKCSDALNPTKMANCPTQSEYDLLDQTSDSCFTKYPDKKPKWLKLKGSKTSEASASNLEVTLASVQDFH